MIAGGSGDGQQGFVVVVSVAEQEVAGELEKRQRGRGIWCEDLEHALLEALTL
jgi:hypothetical protein